VISPLWSVIAAAARTGAGVRHEFLGGLLDSAAFVWRLDGAEPHGLFGDLVDN
jgi:hypothetical protein